MSLQSPLIWVLGLGSARDGSSHWWAQRLTAVALVPLTIWFAFSLLGIPLGEYATLFLWIAKPLNAILLILFVLILVYHSSLGLQVVIEDYVHGSAKAPVLIVVQVGHVVLAVAGIYSIVLVMIEAAR